MAQDVNSPIRTTTEAWTWKKLNFLGKGAFGQVFLGITSTGMLMAVKQACSALAAALPHANALQVWSSMHMRAKHQVNAFASNMACGMLSSVHRKTSWLQSTTTTHTICCVQVEKPAAHDEATRRNLQNSIRELEGEIITLQKLKHPNIVQYYGCERTETHINIFLEWVPCGSIRKLLDEHGVPLGHILRSAALFVSQLQQPIEQ